MDKQIQESLKKVRNRLLLFLLLVELEVILLGALFLGLLPTWGIFVVLVNPVAIYLSYSACALIICPSCKQWFYRKPSQAHNGFSEEELNREHTMNIVRIGNKCQNCGIKWGFR